MDSDPNAPSPLLKALRLAALFISLSLVGFVLLGFVALNVPEDWLLRNPESSKVSAWLPPKGDIPAGLILIGEYITTNADVADNYPDRQTMLDRLETWGREESYVKEYMPPERCTQTGPRSIRVSIILHKENAGAQAYLEWLGQKDRDQGYQVQSMEVGEGGYQSWNSQESRCGNGESEQTLEILFRRGHALGGVYLRAANGNLEEDLFAVALRLAQILDTRIASEIAR